MRRESVVSSILSESSLTMDVHISRILSRSIRVAVFFLGVVDLDLVYVVGCLLAVRAFVGDAVYYYYFCSCCCSCGYCCTPVILIAFSEFFEITT